MENYYTDEKNAQVLISLLKDHGISKVIASPGSANSAIVASLQRDSFFEMYSSVDERSAAYIACGLVAETGEPVVISCTGATASRNYLPGLTEAFYRKLPLLAVTSTQELSRIGHHVAQVIDRSFLPVDTVNYKVTLPFIKDEEDLWDCEMKVNRALIALKRQGGGPVHINIPTNNSGSFGTKKLPKFRFIEHISTGSFPPLPKGNVAIFIGSHFRMSQKLADAIDRFCVANNAAVFCDHTSNYRGKYRLLYALAACQHTTDKNSLKPDLLIHIGEVSGDYYTAKIRGLEVWRVSEDGEIRDTFRRLRYIFEMPEQHFFEYYTSSNSISNNDYLKSCQNQLSEIRSKLPELPFSNPWIASRLANRIPEGSTVHFGILNSLRSWNFYDMPNSVSSASNVGGFGIDGGVSSLIGASFANKDKLYFAVIGDLAFFYDMNVIGNRHVGRNLRILLVNNGKGTEFRHQSHLTGKFGETADSFVAAAGHFGNKSLQLVKHYAQDLGFQYIQASDKDQFEKVYENFLAPEITEKSIVFEVFTDSVLESEALEMITNANNNFMNVNENLKIKTKQFAKNAFGDKNINVLKKIVRGK